MSGVLVVAETRLGALRPVSLELLNLAGEIAAQGGGPVRVLLVGAEADPGDLAAEVVEEVLVAPSPLDHFEAHVSQRALEAAIAELSPAVVLAAHSVDSFGFVPAVAATGGHGFAADITGARWADGLLTVCREAFAGRLQATLSFPGHETAVLMVRPGLWEPAESGGEVASRELAAALGGTDRCRRIELAAAPVGEVDITKADCLLSIGRGIEEADNVARFEELAEKLGATLSASRPLVDAGWVEKARQVGQSGTTVAPKVYLAFGISGAVQHIAGMAGAETIIAVNSDPEARIFSVADYGVVADLFDVADELERQLA